MTIAASQPLNLDQFLQQALIEESPAWEFLHGAAIQKPMFGGKHSRLQSRLAAAINAIGSEYEAFPELRCTFGGQSIVPDLSIIPSEQLPVDANSDIISSFPDERIGPLSLPGLAAIPLTLTVEQMFSWLKVGS